MLWSKQFYYYIVEEWVDGDPKYPSPRPNIRNHEWKHLFSDEIISMPDKWEYPWFAAWDLAFHAIPLAVIDPAFAKLQLDRLTREWFMHPNGQLPAYEWSFSDVNPPVHAWATLRVYQNERKMYGYGDQQFLERVFQKLLLNFTWWVNRKDAEGKNVFQGGFLGLDNIGVFDLRGCPLIGMHKYPDLGNQHERYTKAGFKHTEVYTMLQMYPLPYPATTTASTRRKDTRSRNWRCWTNWKSGT